MDMGMFKKLRKNLDLLTWDEAENIASAIYKKLMSRTNMAWLRNDEWSKEIKSGYKLREKSSAKVKRQLAHKISKNLTKKCAKALDIELKSGRCRKENQFIIHRYMNPWMLFEEHAGHIKHPLKNYSLWYTRGHRQWCDSLIDEDSLIADFIGLFEGEYSQEFANKQIKEIARTEMPVLCVAYEILPNRPGETRR